MKDSPTLETATVEWLRRETPHYECEDCWYSCSILTCDEHRKSDECDCGADQVNAAKADIRKALGL